MALDNLGRPRKYIVKRCTKCFHNKPLDEFYSFWRGWVRKYMCECKECTKKRTKANYTKKEANNAIQTVL